MVMEMREDTRKMVLSAGGITFVMVLLFLVCVGIKFILGPPIGGVKVTAVDGKKIELVRPTMVLAAGEKDFPLTVMMMYRDYQKSRDGVVMMDNIAAVRLTAYKALATASASRGDIGLAGALSRQIAYESKQNPNSATVMSDPAMRWVLEAAAIGYMKNAQAMVETFYDKTDSSMREGAAESQKQDAEEAEKQLAEPVK